MTEAAHLRPPFTRNEDDVLLWGRSVVKAVRDLQVGLRDRTDAELRSVTESFRRRLSAGASSGEFVVEAFAAVAEAASRVLGENPFDAQLLGSAALHLGRVVEMRTGEGKTLAATLPAYVTALTGRPVHVITANDFLARRDADWMRPVFDALGISVGVLAPDGEQDNRARREAYAAEVTYGPWQQFGYDYLRDNLAWSADEQVQRGRHLAIVDEADLILIDEARTPLLLSGPAETDPEPVRDLAWLAGTLDRDVYYEVDECNRTVWLTESGDDYVQELLQIGNLYEESSLRVVHGLQNALLAKELYRRDRDYLVVEDRLVVIDEASGRLQPGRRYGDGLQQALEAKENLTITEKGQVLAQVPVHEYVRGYDRLTAMTGTAAAEADAYRDLYELDLVTIPTNRPMIRVDHQDVLYVDGDAKLNGLVAEAADRHATGQPVLIGSASITESEDISGLLTGRGIAHQVLNAKNHHDEAAILAEAGQRGTVTVVTRMAGRGVDIKLGGSAGAGRDEVADLGGLCVLGAVRHQLARLDTHLRGRAGRQGDPGESKFFVALDDELMASVCSPRQLRWMRWVLKMGPSNNKRIRWVLDRGQRNLQAGITASLIRGRDYDAVVAHQRDAIYADRQTILTEDVPRDHIDRLIDQVLERLVVTAESLDEAELWRSLNDLYPCSLTAETVADSDLSRSALLGRLHTDARDAYTRREAELGSANMRVLERRVLLAVTDRHWRAHLKQMMEVCDGVWLRAMAGRSPLAEYRREADEAYETMCKAIAQDAVGYLFNLEIDI